MIQQSRSTFVITDPTEIVRALVGLKDVRVLAYERRGPDTRLVIEQTLDEVRCPRCAGAARVKDRPVVTYIDLPVFGSPMRLTWRKHRMRCVDPACAMTTWVLRDHRIAAVSCLLTTRAAKWATEQVGTGRSVKEVAHELPVVVDDHHVLVDDVEVDALAPVAPANVEVAQPAEVAQRDVSARRRCQCASDSGACG